MPPIVLRLEGNETSLPFSNLDQDELSKTWRVCTKVKDSLENGSRLENLSWRLWFMQNVVFASDMKTSASKSNKSSKHRQTVYSTAVTEQAGINNDNQTLVLQQQQQRNHNHNHHQQKAEQQQHSSTRIDILPSSANEFAESVLDYSLDDVKPVGTQNFALNQFTSDQDDDQIIELKDIFPLNDMQEFMCPILKENPTTTNSVAQFPGSNSGSSNNDSTSPSFIRAYYDTPSTMVWEPTTTAAANANISSTSAAIYGNQSNNATIMEGSNNNEAMTYATNLSSHFMPAVSKPVASTTSVNTTATINNSTPTATKNNYDSINTAAAMPKPITGIHSLIANQTSIPSITIPCCDEHGNLNSNITSAAAGAHTEQLSPFSQAQQDFIVNYNNAAYVAAAAATTAAALTTIPNATLHNKLLATLPPKTLASAERLLSPARYAPFIPQPTRNSFDSTLQPPQPSRPSTNFLTPNYNDGYNDHLHFVNSNSNSKYPQRNSSSIGSHDSTGPIVPSSAPMHAVINRQSVYYDTFQAPPSSISMSSSLSPLTAPQQREDNRRNSSIKSNSIIDSSRSTSTTLPVISTHSSNDDKMLVCSNCEATSTPLWRRSTDDKVLCNACGLYYKLHKTPRPKHMKKDNNNHQLTDHMEPMDIDNNARTDRRQSTKQQHPTSSTSSINTATMTAPRQYHRRNKQPPTATDRVDSIQDTNDQQSSQQAHIECSNCKTTKTPLWRRDVQGAPLCNACGLYLKLHNEMRPLSMKTDVIKKRQRTESLITSAVAQDNLKKPRYYDQKSLFSARNSDGSVAPAYKNAVTSLPGTGILMMTTNMNTNKASSSSATTSTST